MTELSTHSAFVPYSKGQGFSYGQLYKIHSLAGPEHKKEIDQGYQKCWDAMKGRVNETTLKEFEKERDDAISRAANALNAKYLLSDQGSTALSPSQPSTRALSSHFPPNSPPASSSSISGLRSLAWILSLCDSTSDNPASSHGQPHFTPTKIPTLSSALPSTTSSERQSSPSSYLPPRSLADLL